MPEWLSLLNGKHTPLKALRLGVTGAFHWMTVSHSFTMSSAVAWRGHHGLYYPRG